MKTSRPFLCLAAMLALMCSPLGVQAETALERIARSGQIVLGYREETLPFSYRDGDAEPTGYAIDLCQRIVQALSRELKHDLVVRYRPVTVADRVDAVAKGEVDIECGSTTNTAERRKVVSFTVPHFITTTRFMVTRESGISSPLDLRGKVVVTTRNTVPEKLFAGLNIPAQLTVATEHAEAFHLLESGQASAFFMDDILLAGFRAKSADPERYRILPEAYWVDALSLMLPRDDLAFKALVDKEMKRLALDGGLETLYRKWFEHPLPRRNINLHLPMSKLLRDSCKFPSDWAP